MTPQYKDYEKLIRSKCRSLLRKYSRNPYLKLEFEDLIGEANVNFVIAANRYNKEKSKFSTYLMLQIERGVQDIIREQLAQKRFHVEITESDFEYEFLDLIPDYTLNPEERCILADSIDKASAPAKEMANFILSHAVSRFKMTKNNLRHYLSKAGWKEKYIKKGFKEIKSILETI